MTVDAAMAVVDLLSIARYRQIVPAALFKMLRTAASSDKRRIRIRRRIYASGPRHKSSAGNEKRRASRRLAQDIRLRIEMICGRVQPFRPECTTDDAIS